MLLCHSLCPCLRTIAIRSVVVLFCENSDLSTVRYCLQVSTRGTTTCRSVVHAALQLCPIHTRQLTDLLPLMHRKCIIRRSSSYSLMCMYTVVVCFRMHTDGVCRVQTTGFSHSGGYRYLVISPRADIFAPRAIPLCVKLC